jgi:hypothetical protein
MKVKNALSNCMEDQSASMPSEKLPASRGSGAMCRTTCTLFIYNWHNKQGPFCSTSAHAETDLKQCDADYPNLLVPWPLGLWKSRSGSQIGRNGVKLAIDMGPLWNFLGEYREGSRWLKKAMDQIEVILAESDPGSEEKHHLLFLKAKTLYEYGYLIWFQSQYLRSGEIFAQASELFKQTGDATGLAYSNMFLAHPRGFWVNTKLRTTCGCKVLSILQRPPTCGARRWYTVFSAERHANRMISSRRNANTINALRCLVPWAMAGAWELA